MKKLTVLIALLPLLLFVCACTLEPQEIAPSQMPHPANTLLTVIRGDGTKVYLSQDEVRDLPVIEISVNGQTISGPNVPSILKAAGVDKFSKLIITGSVKDLSLNSERITDNTILSFTKRATLYLADSTLAAGEWVQDVDTLEVK